MEINASTILNNIYFFKYYLGSLPFFVNYDYRFKLNFNYFSFTILYKFFNKNLYFVLFFFINDIYMHINKLNLNCYIEHAGFKYIIKDMNFFLEKKNSLGFFDLKNSVIFEIVFERFYHNNFLASLYKLKV